MRFSGTVRSWRKLVYRRKTIDQPTAAGYVCSFPCDAQTSFIVIEHWNGTAWKAQKLARSVTGEPRSRIGLPTPPRKTARRLTHHPRNAFA